MFIVSVLPLTKTFGQETLSYFSATNYEPGMMVKVSLRTREVRALVVGSKPASEARMELRTSGFSLKKIKAGVGKIFVSQAFMRAVERFAEFETQGFAATLSSLLPVILFETKRNVTPTEPKGSLVDDISAFQGNSDERFTQYRALIRETFARKKSFFLLVPTTEDAKAAEKELSRGIEPFTVVFSGNKKRREIEKALKVIDNLSHPVLTIATAPFLCLLRNDTETIVVDRENSRAYKTPARPNLDFRIFAKILCREYCVRLILGSDLLSVDTVQKVKEGEINEWGHLKMREEARASVSVISMVKTDTGKPFEIFSEELKQIIEKVTQDRKRIFLFGARKGLSPVTVCADCETTVICEVCGAPLILYGSGSNKSKPFFLCHKCGEKKKALDECKNCGGWRLLGLGIGIESIEKEVQKISPYARLFKLDKESAPNPKNAFRIAEEFLKTPGSVLVGTELALHYLREAVEIAAVVSADSLLGYPDFRVNEKIMALLLKVRSLGREKVFFQTRSPENNIFEYAAEGNLLNFFEREINERKKFAFPPFSLFIKIVWQGSPLRAEKDKRFVGEIFGDVVQIVKVREGARLIRFHGLIKIEDPKVWPEKTLVQKLLSLPPQFSVFVDPETLL